MFPCSKCWQHSCDCPPPSASPETLEEYGRTFVIQGRDPGDESDTLTPRLAWVGLVPVCPKCGCQLAAPFRLWDRDTKWHEVTCFAGGCGQRVIAKWFEEQQVGV